MIHSCGLSFSLASDPKFRRVLTHARMVGSNFQPPGRNEVSGTLLDLNYEAYLKKHHTILMKDVTTYGLTFYGDGATVRKMPLINVMASGAHLPICVLEIVDCSKQMQTGKKDAPYIASLFKPHIEKVESDSPSTCDVIFFDGASNVQQAGTILHAKYPRLVVLHGSEHVINLFFQDLFQLPLFKSLNIICNRIYRVFGGSMHGPYAHQFQKHAKEFNVGRSIGLLRAAGTRMAGFAIAMQSYYD